MLHHVICTMIHARYHYQQASLEATVWTALRQVLHEHGAESETRMRWKRAATKTGWHLVIEIANHKGAAPLLRDVLRLADRAGWLD